MEYFLLLVDKYYLILLRKARVKNMVLLFLADGFEEIEALTPVDVLRRAGVELKTVAVGKGKEKTVIGSHKIPVTADLTMSEAIKLCREPETVILPGGMPGSKNLDADPDVDSYLSDAFRRGALICAICAAPFILGKRGMLKGKRATCFPGFENYLDGADYSGGRVETDGNFITACGMGAATEFALAIIKKMKGESAANELGLAILAK